jgi:hypothetical protein
LSFETGTATNYLDLLARLNAFLIKGHALPPLYSGTGTGTITLLMGTSSSVMETITCTFTSATAFNVVGSVTGAMGAGTVGTPFAHAKCTFTVVAGGTAWANGDTISFVMTPPWVALKDVVGFAASSTYGDGNGPNMAFDGNAASCWESANGVTSGWVEVDFGSPHTFVEYVVQARNDISQPASAPLAWALEYWNGSAWAVADTRTAQTGWTQGQKRVFTISAPPSSAKWRLNISANNGFASYVDLGELELREAAGGVDVALQGCVWRAPGNANTDMIYVGVRPYYHAATDYYNWRLGGFTGFTAGSLWDSQPGANVTSHLYLWNGSIPYWFIADGKHVAIVAHVSTVYECAYLGFGDTYASPGQYPYPLMVGGSACFSSEPVTTSLNWRWSYTGAEHAAFWRGLNGANSPLKLRRVDGTWAAFDSSDPITSSSYGSLWPYVCGQSGLTYLVTNLDGATYPLFPIIPNEAAATYGELTGVMATTGYLQNAENTITVNRIPWLVVPNIYRSTRSDFAAIRLA